jgi:diguanylate cyclase (GGDEF)-like protein
MLRATGYDINELVDKSLSILLKTDDFEDLYKSVTLSRYSEKTIYTRDGTAVPCQLSGTAVEDGFGDFLGTVCIFHDISEKKKLINELELRVEERTSELKKSNDKLKEEIDEREKIQDKIRFLAYHDPLTELPNRLRFNERLTEAIKQAEIAREKLAVVYLDLDNFKLINDSLGHQKGDELLYEAALRLSEIVEGRYMAARVGGDEFCILITGINDRDSIVNVIHKMLDSFNKPFVIDLHEFHISSSIGVSFFPADGNDPEALVGNADLTMYEAKAAGKNTYKFCSDEIKQRFKEKAKLRNNLYKALDRDEIAVHYQPVINLHDSSIAGLEALMRWRTAKVHDISPAEFIPLAEETGLITIFGKWLIIQVCRQIKTWKDSGLNSPRVSVNLSEKQLKQPGFVNFITSVLHDYGLDHDVLEFEITERVVFKGNEEIISVLEELKRLGFLLSIDDFGVDYSSFLNVKKLPIDKIKIDMQFIQGIKANRKDTAIVEAIINLSHNLGLCVVAEGIETNDHLDFLIHRDCDQGQGFLFYKPMPGNQIDKIL